MSTENPFGHLVNEAPITPAETRRELFTNAKRGYARIQKNFVQNPERVENRGSVLGKMVTDRKERALELLLTIHALEPILEGSPLPIGTWARLLSSEKRPCSSRTIREALRYLSGANLLQVPGQGESPEIVLLREDGSGRPPLKTGAALPAETQGNGFFTIPFTFWTEGHIDTLRLPGKAMLLMMLRDTNDPKGKTTFTVPVERAQAWYGISERTAERGYGELSRHGLIASHVQKVADARSPVGYRAVHHRALLGDYSTAHREQLRKEANAAAKAKG
ncbi:hypothetical protein [Zhihengliuella salsuginis]|nr:hypothetical protein [Zhihengliuella salsuginis]